MIKNEELINILRAMGFEWYRFEDSTDGNGGCFSIVRNNKEEWYYIRIIHFTDKWRVEVRNCEKDNEGTLSFENNEISLEDINTLIRICKINLILK